MNDHSPAIIEVSVCIANYNGASVLEDCLRSVFSQRTACSVEVIVHDDASTDDSLALIREQFPAVRIVESRVNAGFCVSNNRMADIARGRYLLLLNNDATLRPGSIAALWEESQHNAEPAILGLPQYTLHDGSLIDHGYEFDLFMNPVPVFSTTTHEVAAATGACLWIPRQVWDAVGGFPAWFESVAEDIFLCQAARLLGYPTVVLGAPGFDHWIGAQLGGGKITGNRLRTTARRRALSERNKTGVMLLCYPIWALILAVPVHALLLGIEATFLKLSGIDAGKVARIYGNMIPSLWRERATIRSLRRQLQSRKRLSGLRYMRRFSLLPHKLHMLLRYGRPEIG